MKEKNLGRKIFFLIFGIIIATGVIYIVWSMYQSTKIRKFELQLNIMSNETKVCKAEYQGEEISISTDYVKDICYEPLYMKATTGFGFKASQEDLKINMLQRRGGQNWVFLISSNDEKIKLNLSDGDTSYTFYFQKDLHYDRLVEIVEKNRAL